MTQQLPYGTWPSPVTPEMLTHGSVGLVDVWFDGDETVWLESRAAEQGRLQLVAAGRDGVARDLLPDGFSARSMVHEYGGGAAHVAGGAAWFVNFADQQVYYLALHESAAPVALTAPPAEPRAVRYADLRVSPDGSRLVCVRERHLGPEAADVVNDLVVLPAMPGAADITPVVVHDGTDFVMSPAWIDDRTIRCITWDHPNMPWDDTALVEITLDATGPRADVLASGCSMMQPDGRYVISDRSGWWNLWSIGADGATAVDPADHEIGGPAWVFGLRDYAVLADGSPVYAVAGTLHVRGAAHPTDAMTIEQFTATGDTVTAIARYADRNPAVIRFDAATPSEYHVVVASRPTGLAAADISVPEPIRYPTPGGTDAYGWFYPPTNAAFDGPDGAQPPLVVMIHGGPTSNAVPTFALAKQFWTSRGFAVVDVDHRGSTGYGTAFRRLLHGAWGVVDVQDCAAAATWLADQGRVARSRLVIRGGSAGGFTVLASLATTAAYAGGADLFGIADLSALAADTHKFECRYLDSLLGPWPAAEAVWRERSPITHLDRFDTPLIVFQGADDKVVLPSQSELIVRSLRAKGVRCEYHLYEGEGHGFRQAATIVAQLTSELAFYRDLLGLGGGDE